MLNTWRCNLFLFCIEFIFHRNCLNSTFFYKQPNFFGQDFCCLSYRVISGLKLLRRLLTNQKVTKTFWREIMLVCKLQKFFSLTTWICLLMILFVYKLVRQSKVFCTYYIVLYYCIGRVLSILKLYDFLHVNFLHINFCSPLFWEG